MYQGIYSFEGSDPSKHQDKSMYFDPDEQFTQLANEFNIRYDSAFDQPSHDAFSSVVSNENLLSANNDVRDELSFDAFHGVSVFFIYWIINTEQDISSTLVQDAPIYNNILQESNVNTSLIAKTTIHTLPPLQHHPTASHHTYLLTCKKPIKGLPHTLRERAPWTPDEDQLLRLAVELYGDKTEKWSKIAICVPGRTNKNCRKRWFHSLDPSLRKGAWTDEEDQLLREGVSRYPNQWSKIADMLEGRTDDQCAKRWRESLDPSIDRSEWTPEEDTRLLQKYDEYGSQWQKIAFYFEGRPGLHCRNRWRKLQRMIQIKKDKQLNTSFVNTLLKNEQPTVRKEKMIPKFRNEENISTETAKPSTDISIQYTASPNADDEFEDGQTPFGCDMPSCFAEFSSSSGLFTHMKKAHLSLSGVDKPYRCSIKNCTKRYKNINGLQYHLKDAKRKGTTGYGHSSLLEEKPFTCSILNCKKAYRTANGLRYHTQHGHTKNHQEPHIIPFGSI
ncbi:hypothetical protein BY458DRAFT_455724 [Sporodiniella umbellata]|nr:hypothetical protein BY458DRAFT_455724 [Sporodiniella umbellata]